MFTVPNPFMRGRVVTSKRVDRPEPITPVVEEYAGDNVPYRGTVDHGAPYSDDFRETFEDMSLRPDGRLVDVYESEDTETDPIPVYIVNQSSRERRAFRSVVAYAGGTDYGRARQLLGQDESRTRATIYNKSTGIDLWISDSAETANSVSGFYVKDGTSYVTESQEPIYATAVQPGDLAVYIGIEYRVSLDG